MLSEFASFPFESAGKIVRAPSGVMHGKSSLVYYDEKKEPSLFHGLPKYDHTSLELFPTIS